MEASAGNATSKCTFVYSSAPHYITERLQAQPNEPIGTRIAAKDRSHSLAEGRQGSAGNITAEVSQTVKQQYFAKDAFEWADIISNSPQIFAEELLKYSPPLNIPASNTPHYERQMGSGSRRGSIDSNASTAHTSVSFGSLQWTNHDELSAAALGDDDSSSDYFAYSEDDLEIFQRINADGANLDYLFGNSLLRDDNNASQETVCSNETYSDSWGLESSTGLSSIDYSHIQRTYTFPSPEASVKTVPVSNPSNKHNQCSISGGSEKEYTNPIGSIAQASIGEACNATCKQQPSGVASGDVDYRNHHSGEEQFFTSCPHTRVASTLHSKRKSEWNQNPNLSIANANSAFRDIGEYESTSALFSMNSAPGHMGVSNDFPGSCKRSTDGTLQWDNFHGQVSSLSLANSLYNYGQRCCNSFPRCQVLDSSTYMRNCHSSPPAYNCLAALPANSFGTNEQFPRLKSASQDLLLALQSQDFFAAGQLTHLGLVQSGEDLQKGASFRSDAEAMRTQCLQTGIKPPGKSKIAAGASTNRRAKKWHWQKTTHSLVTSDPTKPDGYMWRTNGNRREFKCRYFRCRNHRKHKCPVTKLIKELEDGTFLVKYHGEHIPFCVSQHGSIP